MESVLEKLCKNKVDVVHKTFTRKYYLFKISKKKRGYIYLIVKKRGLLLYEEKEAPHRKIFIVVSSIFSWYCKRQKQLEKKYFFNQKLIKECSRYHFHYF